MRRSAPKSFDGASAPAIECLGVTKRFYYYEHRTTSLRELFVRAVLRRPLSVKRAYFQVRGLNLRIDSGESVALVGPNGCGKSTTLRLIAGIYAPSEGIVRTRGRVAAVIELGAGFHPELTGAENVAMCAAVLGLSRRQLNRRYREMVEFAEVEEFIDVPLKYYSSGMRARLAFAVTVFSDPDILLLDEVLAVGDQSFRERCLERLRRFHAERGTLVVVSHDLASVRALCSRAVWMQDGTVLMDGPANDVLDAYEATSEPQPLVSA